ncbi:OsmC family protein [uncultured Cocleimonas sp.]|uniref:OsmC family protein n=1 Tax=uncultured Cocleimonas sp. TaxID=1051587 RepID=UPI00262F9BAD|nr:OsmC family protein [uncultured Cocleimonas sp.]
MSDIPLNYQTAYEWTGDGEKGEIHIGELPVLPIGSPHNADRYCPEHILVVAAEACLANYVLLISQKSRLEVKAYQSTAEGELLKEDTTGYRFKRIVIRPVLTVESGKENTAEKIIHKAHDLCMVARALNCPVDIEPIIKTAK